MENMVNVTINSSEIIINMYVGPGTKMYEAMKDIAGEDEADRIITLLEENGIYIKW